MKVNIQNIPKSLRETGAWCVWRYEEREGKPTKVPYNPRTSVKAKSNNVGTFGTFEQACFAKDMNGFDGIGIGVFDDICAIDIDHCIEDGVFSDMASEIFELMNSYTEISPSGTGLRILFRAPGFRYDKTRYYINNQKLGLEIYCAGFTNKFVTITGNAVHMAGINNRSDELQEILGRFMRREVRQNHKANYGNNKPVIKLSFSDSLLIRKAEKAQNGDLFKRLMGGDCSDYDGDESRADMALCNILAFWTSNDAAQIDRIFRSSKLMRDKWDRPTAGSTYGAITIQEAINQVDRTYSDMMAEKREKDRQPIPVKPRRGGETYGW